LTLDAPSKDLDKIENRPDSVFDIAIKNNLTEVFIVDNTLSGLVEAYENAKKSEVNLRFGYRVNVCNSLDVKTEDYKKTESKFIIFAANESFKDLIHLHNISCTSGLLNGSPRLDFDQLRLNWSNNLMLGVPFYDSYLHFNSLYGRECVPQIDFTDPWYFSEDNSLPFDNILNQHLNSVVKPERIIKSKTIYYNRKKDFKAYMTYRCILNRTTFQKPNLNHFGSDEFCMESFLNNER
jgi:DNA polymerase III alpha subunit